MRLLGAAALIALLSGCAAIPSVDPVEVVDRHTGKRYSCMLDNHDPLGNYCIPATWPKLAGFPWSTAKAQ